MMIIKTHSVVDYRQCFQESVHYQQIKLAIQPTCLKVAQHDLFNLSYLHVFHTKYKFQSNKTKQA